MMEPDSFRDYGMMQMGILIRWLILPRETRMEILQAYGERCRTSRVLFLPGKISKKDCILQVLSVQKMQLHRKVGRNGLFQAMYI